MIVVLRISHLVSGFDAQHHSTTFQSYKVHRNFAATLGNILPCEQCCTTEHDLQQKTLRCWLECRSQSSSWSDAICTVPHNPASSFFGQFLISMTNSLTGTGCSDGVLIFKSYGSLNSQPNITLTGHLHELKSSMPTLTEEYSGPSLLNAHQKPQIDIARVSC